MRSTESELYISVDIEASGPIPGIYSMLAVGACVVGQSEETFYAELRPTTDNYDPEALRVSSLSMENLKATGRQPEEVMASFGTWIKACAGPRRPVFVAFNNSFDWSFVNWYFHRYTGSNPFGIGGLDIKAYYMGMVNCPWSDTTSSRLPEPFRGNLPQTHNALDDARAQADIFARLLASRSHTG